MNRTVLTLRPAISTLVWMSAIAAPFIVYPLWHLPGLLGASEWTLVTALSFGVVVGLGVWLLLEISTVRVHLTEDQLCLRRYWRTHWSVPRASVELRRGGVGDIPVLPGFRVFDARTQRQVGAIPFSQFRPDDLEALERALRPLEVESGPRGL